MTDWNETIQAMNKTDELLAEITRLRSRLDDAETEAKTREDYIAMMHKSRAQTEKEFERLDKRYSAMLERLDEAEKVIKPFADESYGLPRYLTNFALVHVAMGDLRAAAKWMEDKS